MKQTRLRAAALAIFASSALLFSACSTEQDGAAAPDDAGAETTETSETAETDESDGAGASAVDAVENPKDVEGVDICSLLTADVATAFGLDPTGEPAEDSAATGGRCTWSSDAGARIGLAAWTGGRGIEDVNNQQAIYSEWEPTEVEGYPGAFANSGASEIMCGLFVAISDTQYLDFSYARGSDSDEDSCVGVVDVATAVVPTLPDAN